MAKCSQCKSKIDAPFWRYTTICPQCAMANQALQDQLKVLTPDFIVTPCLIGLNVLVFCAMVLSGVSPMEPDTADLLKWGASFGPLTLGGQPWRAITSTFVHIGIIHIALNMWCLWNIGQLAERLMGNVRFLLLYMLSGVGGSILSLWLHPQLVSAGASGAIFGLAGGLVTILALKKAPLSSEAMKPRLKSMLFFIGYNLLYGMKGGIDNAAHLGGLISGALLAALIPRQSQATNVNPPTDSQAINRLDSGESGAFKVGAAVLACAFVAWFGYVQHVYSSNPQKSEFFELDLLSLNKSDRTMVQDASKSLAEGKATAHAIEELEAVESHSPGSGLVHLILAEAYSQKTQNDKASEEFQKAITLHPNYGPAHTEYGSALLRTDSVEKAMAEFQAALRINPSDADAHNALGACFEEKNDLQSALKEFGAAVKTNPDNQDFKKNFDRVSSRASH